MNALLSRLAFVLRRLNYTLLASSALLAATGVCFVRSAASVRQGELQFLYMEHLQFAIAGLVIMLATACVNYRSVIRFAPLFYAGTIAALVAVLFIGTWIMGARRWLFGIQPSEVAKIAVVALLAYLLGHFRNKLQGFKGFAACGLIVALPAGLILLQPDLGTAIVLAPTFLAMLFTANIAPRIFWPLIFTGVAATLFVLGAIYTANVMPLSEAERERRINATFLRKHQVERVEVFLFPDRMIHDEGYNARQSEIAVGSGGWTGKGYLKGDQNMLGYLPPSVSANDFIFPVLAEETGFVGSVALLLLFLGGIFVPGIIVGARCADDTGKLLCVGITTLMFCHMFINIAMTVRLVPITGLPLPFISYGGTFMLTMMFAVGIVQSVAVYGREQEHVFIRTE